MKRAASRSISPPSLFPAAKLNKFANSINGATQDTKHGSHTDLLPRVGHESALPFPEENQQGTCKVITWNCDGLTQYLSALPTAMDSFLKKSEPSPGSSFLPDFIKRHEPDILCMQEVHLWSSEMKQIVRQLRVDAYGYEVHSCLPYGKSGRRRAGVLTLFKSNLKHISPTTVDWDHEGRVSVLKMPGLHIFNVYGLNSSENPFKHPITGVVNGNRSERKRVFDSQLAHELESAVKDGNAVLLVGDLNVSREKIDALGGHLRTNYPHDLNRKHFNQVFGPYRDVIRERFPNQEKYSWFSRAGDDWTGNNDKARVDHIIASEGLQVLDADTMEKPGDRGRSDHGPVFVTFVLPDEHPHHLEVQS